VLRFFNPAIITPETLRMLPEEVKPDNLDHQNLIAITRLLQKLSNNVIADPGTAGEWMDPFVESNNGRMRVSSPSVPRSRQSS
jgi:hypothetical protein